MCNINITSQKFRFPICPFCFLLFIFFVFFLFFLFFPFSFPVFLLSFLLHAQAIHGRIRGRRSLHARLQGSSEFQVWAPPLTHGSQRLRSLTRALASTPNQSPRVSHARGKRNSSKLGVGAATQIRSQLLPRIARALPA